MAQEKEHQYEFDSDWDADTQTIIIKVIDTVTKRQWIGKYDKRHYNNPSKEYDDMVDVFGDNEVDFKCKYDAINGDLTVKFVQGKLTHYQFFLDQTK